MSDNTELLKCPACGAPLDVPAGQSVVKCPYCHNTVSVGGAAPAPEMPGADVGLGMARVVQLARSGNKIEAIKLFRQITNVGLADAKNAVEAIERGESIDLTSVHFGRQEAPAEEAPTWEPASRPTGQPTKRKSGGCAVLITVLVIAAIAIAAFFMFRHSPAVASISPLFANETLSFGTEGTGPGMLNDPRYVGVDRDGNIYVGDYMDGRINIFDSTGKYLRLINLGNKVLIQGMAVAPDGTIYISHDGRIHKLDPQGNDTEFTYNDSDGYPIYFEGIALGADGSVVGADQDEELVRFNSDGVANLVIPQVFTSVTGDSELDIQLAVDGLGNIYALGTFNNLVLKYSPEGKYLDQFGGETTKPAEGVDKGHFQAPDTIAVDGYGRVYVSDIWGVQVFDSNGQYLEFIDPNGVAFGMAFDLNNNLFIASNKPLVIKMSVKQP